MRESTLAMINKIHNELIKREYVKVHDLCKLTRLKPCSVYRLIRIMRLEGIGIFPTRKGYILSEYASKQDDVHFIRRCYGRRTADIIAIKSSEKHIKKRWKALSDKNNIIPVLNHLTVQISQPKLAEQGVKYLLSYINSKGN